MTKLQIKLQRISIASMIVGIMFFTAGFLFNIQSVFILASCVIPILTSICLMITIMAIDKR